MVSCGEISNGTIMNEEESEIFVEKNKGWLVPLTILRLFAAAFLFGRAVAYVFSLIS